MKSETKTVNKPLIEEKINIQIMTINSNKQLIVYAIGIFVCYFYYGILQEKMYKIKY
jgi:hypothetical protein